MGQKLKYTDFNYSYKSLGLRKDFVFIVLFATALNTWDNLQTRKMGIQNNSENKIKDQFKKWALRNIFH